MIRIFIVRVIKKATILPFSNSLNETNPCYLNDMASAVPAAPAVTVEVIIHPLVLLSVADHYNRVAKDSSNRVVGVLLGNRDRGGKVDVLNSYAVPFEEDLANPSVWFLDHNFLDTMYWMFKKVNCKSKVYFKSESPILNFFLL